MESFSYGSAPRARRQVGRPVMIVLGLILAAGVAFALFTVTRTGGEAAAQHLRDTTAQVGQASDIQAQASLQTALTSAKVALAESDTFEAADVEYLSSFGSPISFVEGTSLSSGANVVSVQVAPQAWGAAAMSASGTCFWIRETMAGGTAYGSGDPCTGAAAMSATSTAF